MKSIRIGLFAGLLAAANASAAAPGPVSGPANDPTSGPLHGHTTETTGDAGDWVAPALEEFLVTARVVDGTGRPVEGAVVVTAVGGKGVSDPDGLVRMRVQMDPAADRLRVTAYHTAAGETRTGSTIASATGVAIDAGEIPLVMKSGCEPGWEPTFESPAVFNGTVNSLAVFDDGSGPKLYAAGEFTEIGFAEIKRLAVWDGSYWKPIDIEWDNQASGVQRVFVLDGGSGPALYVVGGFRIGEESYSIGRWDGQQWTSLQPSVSMGVVNALAYFDDGDGPKLYAGGSSLRLHRWDGDEWQMLTNTNQSGGINALTVYNDGASSRLYVAGRFNEINGVQANSIAAWDGVEFTALGNGVTVPSSNSTVNALKVLDLGTGPKLYVGGDFTAAGGADSNYIAAWNGAAWEPIGADLLDMGSSPHVHALSTVTVDGTIALAAGGRFTSQSDPEMNGLAAWNGQSWTRLHTHSPSPRAMVEYNDGERTKLFVGGSGAVPGQNTKRYLVALYNGQWERVGGDIPHRITAMAVFDDGNGPVPYAAFDTNDPNISLLNRWNGQRWESLPGPASTSRSVWVLRVLNDGTRDRLYIGGSFPTPGGFANNILIWDGNEYSFVRGENPQDVVSFEMFDDGSGPMLYVGTVGRLLRADETALTIIQGSGMVYAMKVFDDGSGPSLYVAGSFSPISGHPGTRRIARWDGNTWHALGDGLQASEARALAVYDDGTGPALYVGGQLHGAINGPSARGVMKWDGTAWFPLGDGGGNGLGHPPIVRSLRTFDDGTGNALYAGGHIYPHSSESIAIGVARWDGQEWSALAPQIQRFPASSTLSGTYVGFMTPWIDNGVKSLVLAGRFYLPATGEQHAARWRACPPACIPDINGDGIVDADDFFLLLQLFADGDSRADINNDGLIDADDFFEFLNLFALGC